ncbi:MAG: hypothetical protein DME03_03120, partial [Candidatus Rokuibacteriota bacterium]
PIVLQPVQSLVESTDFISQCLRVRLVEALGLRRSRRERGGQGQQEDSGRDDGSHARLLFLCV